MTSRTRRAGGSAGGGLGRHRLASLPLRLLASSPGPVVFVPFAGLPGEKYGQIRIGRPPLVHKARSRRFRLPGKVELDLMVDAVSDETARPGQVVGGS